MIKHVVLLNWQDGASREQIEKVNAGFRALAQEIDEIADYQFGPDAGIYKGNADYAVVAEFESEEDLKAYVVHPRHQAFLREVTGPILASFNCVQFEVDSLPRKAG